MKLGSLQQQDKDLIKAIIKMTKPSVLVEFGHLLGESARSMLEVMGDAKLISYDNTVDSKITDSRFVFRRKCQSEYNEPDLVDFVFLDASHKLDLNIKTLEALNLNDNAIIVVHDTGVWTKNVGATYGYWKDGFYYHCPEEREFINWIKENTDFNVINLHTTKEIRHGITLLQRNNPLTL